MPPPRANAAASDRRLQRGGFIDEWEPQQADYMAVWGPASTVSDVMYYWTYRILADVNLKSGQLLITYSTVNIVKSIHKS